MTDNRVAPKELYQDTTHKILWQQALSPDTEKTDGFLHIVNHVASLYTKMYNESLDLQRLREVAFQTTDRVSSASMTLIGKSDRKLYFDFCGLYDGMRFCLHGRKNVLIIDKNETAEESFSVQLIPQESTQAFLLDEEAAVGADGSEAWSISNFAGLFDSNIPVAEANSQARQPEGELDTATALIAGCFGSIWILFFNLISNCNEQQPRWFPLKFKGLKKQSIDIESVQRVYFLSHHFFLIKESPESDEVTEVTVATLKNSAELVCPASPEAEHVELELDSNVQTCHIDAPYRLLKFEDQCLKKNFGENSIMALDKKTREILEIALQNNPRCLTANVIITDVPELLSNILCAQHKRYIFAYGGNKLKLWAKYLDKYLPILDLAVKAKIKAINLTEDLELLLIDTEDQKRIEFQINLPLGAQNKIFSSIPCHDPANLLKSRYIAQADLIVREDIPRQIRTNWESLSHRLLPAKDPKSGYAFVSSTYVPGSKEFALVHQNNSLKELTVTYFSAAGGEFRQSHSHRLTGWSSVVKGTGKCDSVIIVRLKSDEPRAKLFDIFSKQELDIVFDFSSTRLSIFHGTDVVVLDALRRRLVFYDLGCLGLAKTFEIEKFEVVDYLGAENVFLVYGYQGLIIFKDRALVGTYEINNYIDQYELSRDGKYLTLVKGGICTLHSIEEFNQYGLLVTENVLDVKFGQCKKRPYLFVLHNDNMERTTTVFDLESLRIVHILPKNYTQTNSLMFCEFDIYTDSIVILHALNPMIQSRYDLKGNTLIGLMKHHLFEYFRTDSLTIREQILQKAKNLCEIASVEGCLNDRLLLLLLFLWNKQELIGSYISINNIERLFTNNKLLTLVLCASQAQMSKETVIQTIKKYRDVRKRYFALDSEEFEKIVTTYKTKLIKDSKDEEILRMVLFSPIENPLNCQLKQAYETMAVLDYDFSGFNKHTLHNAVNETHTALTREFPKMIKRYQTCTTLVKVNLNNGSEFSRSLFQVLRRVSNEETKTFTKHLIYHKWNMVYWNMALPYSILFWALAVLAYLFFGYEFESRGLGVAIIVLNCFFLLFELKCLFSEGKHYFLSFWNWADVVLQTFCLASVVAILAKREMQNTTMNWLRLVSVLSIWIRAVTWFRVFRPIRYLVTMVMEVFADILPFLVILTSAILGFAYLLRLSPGLASEDGEIQPRFYPSFYDSIFLIFGNSPSNERQDKTLFVVTIIGNVILALALMNFLIAIISGTFSRIQEEKDLYDAKEILYLIRDFESFISGTKCMKKHRMKHHFATLLPFESDEPAETQARDLGADPGANKPQTDESSFAKDLTAIRRKLEVLTQKVDKLNYNSKLTIVERKKTSTNRLDLGEEDEK